MTRNPPNRIPGLGFADKTSHWQEYTIHTKDMFRPAVRVSFESEDALFRSAR